MILTQTFAAVDWHFGINDPDAFGWIVFAGYIVATFLCVLAARACKRAKFLGQYKGSSHFWIVAAVFLGLLGINKQLDLHVLMTQIARNIAKADGWYNQRVSLQQQALFLGLVFGLAITAYLAYLMRRELLKQGMALSGVIFLMAFVLLRSLSLHNVDTFLTMTFCSIPMRFLFEFCGTVIVCIGAAANLRVTPEYRVRPGDKADHEAIAMRKQFLMKKYSKHMDKVSKHKQAREHHKHTISR